MARRTGSTIAVTGLREYQRACVGAPNSIRKQSREAFRKVGTVVKDDTAQRVAPVSSKSAAGYRTRVLQRGVVVAQSLRKTTGKRPDYGAWQMRQLLRAVAANEDNTVRALERAMDDVARIWETQPRGP
jgi:hypothetical protein